MLNKENKMIEILFKLFGRNIAAKTSLIQDALREIQEWWDVFAKDADYEVSNDVLYMEIKNYLKEDGYPEDIIEKAMVQYHLTH